MTDINYHRKNRKAVNQRYAPGDYRNGYAAQQSEKRVSHQGVGRTDYLDKSLHSWGRKSELADASFGAQIGNDFSNGRRGMAHAVHGAKKYVRSRIRFHENAAAQQMASDFLRDCTGEDAAF